MFPDIPVVIDKYHVVQKINQALDTVRKIKANAIKVLETCALLFTTSLLTEIL
ncbi:transposase [Texcoconibacillus texcoconensis]|uniref:transposase n=1 Tax=Texcoconibacillus texcoconensis TaxID=1095777 RepID=UPI003CCE314D